MNLLEKFLLVFVVEKVPTYHTTEQLSNFSRIIGRALNHHVDCQRLNPFAMILILYAN
jgi:hypothetical protein